MKHSRLLLLLALVAGTSMSASDVENETRRQLLEMFDAVSQKNNHSAEQATMYAEWALSEHAHPDLINTLRQHAGLPPLNSEEYEAAKTEFERRFPHM